MNKVLVRVHQPGTQNHGVYQLYLDDGTWCSVSDTGQEGPAAHFKGGIIGGAVLVCGTREYTPAVGRNVYD